MDGKHDRNLVSSRVLISGAGQEEKLMIVITRKCIPQLLQRPLSRRMFGHVEVENPPRSDLHCDKYIKETEPCRDRNEEMASDNRVRMIADEGGPPLIAGSAWARRLLDVLAHGSRRKPNLEVQQKFIGDTLFTPGGILGGQRIAIAE
jgi:hypothetical protein